jgi:transposase
MASAGRPSAEINLTANERKTLTSWARRHSSAQSLAMRSKIVLGAADGLTNTVIAASVGCHQNTASKWRNRFVTDRLDGLMDADRPGAARTITDDIVEAVVIDTLETAPENATHWSTRELARKHGLNHQRIAEIWHAFGLKPGKQDEFKISPDPLLVDKIRDIVGLYMSPPVAAAVFCVDEKPQIQALNRTAPMLPMMPTTNQRRSLRGRREAPDPSIEPDRTDAANDAHHQPATVP